MPTPATPSTAATRVIALLATLLAGCASPAVRLDRRGQEIQACGQLFAIHAPVVLWNDPDGYDAYRTQKRFASIQEREWSSMSGVPTPNRFGDRRSPDAGSDPPVPLDSPWTLERLRDRIDQVVIHYDAAGTSRSCFRTLHDVRGLSTHFMIDLDGTIYQTLDLKERAWHATIANDRSIGIELANIGAVPQDELAALDRWYSADERGPLVRFPPGTGDGGVRGAGPFRPARPALFAGTINGHAVVMHDFTPAQYESLARLTAALCTIFPKVRCDAPRDASGAVLTRALTPAEFAEYHGLLGHLHVQENKIDPGPAFDWERLVRDARRRLDP